MATVSKETTQDLCFDMAAYALRDVADAVSQFVRELHHAKTPLPDAFDVQGDGWQQAERRIDAACQKLDLDDLSAACSEYKQRANRFLNGWRVKLGMPVHAEATEQTQ